MEGKELKVEETETSHTLGGSIKYTYIHQCRFRNTIGHKSRRICYKGKVSVAKKPMNLCACDSEECEDGVGAGVTATSR